MLLCGIWPLDDENKFEEVVHFFFMNAFLKGCIGWLSSLVCCFSLCGPCAKDLSELTFASFAFGLVGNISPDSTCESAKEKEIEIRTIEI